MNVWRNMNSITSFSEANPNSSALEGFGGHNPGEVDSEVGRREWWLWLSAMVVTMLSTLAFLLSSLPSLFVPSDDFYAIRSDQAAWATMVLFLLFNTWLVYRLWFFRGLRRQATGRAANSSGTPENGSAALDPVTGFYTRGCLEQRLALETVSARRKNTPLSLVALHLDDFQQVMERNGDPAREQVLKEFARRLKKATRGSDFGAHLGGDDFLLVLPECGLASAKLVLERLGPLEIKCGAEDVTLTYSAAWIDYQPGERPADLLERVAQVLQLYKKAAKDYLSQAAAAR